MTCVESDSIGEIQLQSGIELVSQHSSSLRRFGVWCAIERRVSCFDIIRGADSSKQIYDCVTYKAVSDVVPMRTTSWGEFDKRCISYS